MSPEVAALVVAVVVALLRELRIYLDVRARARGVKRTRKCDDPPTGC